MQSIIVTGDRLVVMVHYQLAYKGSLIGFWNWVNPTPAWARVHANLVNTIMNALRRPIKSARKYYCTAVPNAAGKGDNTVYNRYNTIIQEGQLFC